MLHSKVALSLAWKVKVGLFPELGLGGIVSMIAVGAVRSTLHA
jgi:hypothetical protein